MKVLTPTEAALIARGVYQLRTDDVAGLHERGALLGCEDLFQVDDGARFEGRSGAPGWKKLSGFGYIAAGVGAHAGEMLVVTRGTAMLVDWCSNLNIAMQLGPGGHLVHAGFNEVWKSCRDPLHGFLANRNPSRIHCVGHSLGGALAALNADYFNSNGVAEVLLYTFGAPRSGDAFCARSLTRRIGAAQIFRVSHAADPVPKIPLFPFFHLPSDRPGLEIGSGLFGAGAHSMLGSYIPALADRSWATLARSVAADDNAQVKSWLERAAGGEGLSGVGGMVLMGSSALLLMIGRALRWLLARAAGLLAGKIGIALTASATVLDQLAWLLSKGASLARELGEQVTGLMAAIFRFLGRKLPAALDVSVAFVRWVLGLLYSVLQATAQRAIVPFLQQ